MDLKEFKSGTYKSGYKYKYFLPEKINHSFIWSNDVINELLEKASLKLGELNSFSKFVPDTGMFIKMHIYKEAVFSSRIEGTRTNIEEALVGKKDIDPEKRDDWQEVNNYVNALNAAIETLKDLPLSIRLLKNTHKILLSNVRGESKNPGEIRRSQNWIGGASLNDAIFIPPSHEELPELLSDLEKFLNNNELKIPHLIRIAIAHYQFETIHPFLDGNGRIGRLLITLYFVSNTILEKPLLYLSDFFEKNKGSYYDNLTWVREKNDLTQWIKFFLTGVIQTSEYSINTLRKIIDLKIEIESEVILSLGKRSKKGSDLLYLLFRMPVITIKEIQSELKITYKTANVLVQHFENKGILIEKTGYSRNRQFIFPRYLDMF